FKRNDLKAALPPNPFLDKGTHGKGILDVSRDNKWAISFMFDEGEMLSLPCLLGEAKYSLFNISTSRIITTRRFCTHILCGECSGFLRDGPTLAYFIQRHRLYPNMYGSVVRLTDVGKFERVRDLRIWQMFTAPNRESILTIDYDMPALIADRPT